MGMTSIEEVARVVKWMSTAVQGEEDLQVPVPELLGKLLDRHGSDLHLTAGAPPTVRVHGDLERLEEYPPLSPAGPPGHGLRDLAPEAAGAVRAGPRARHVVLAAGARPVPGERVHAARRPRRGLPRDPVRDQERSTSSAFRRSSPSSRATSAGSSSSPGRPARGSRRPWPRWSTSSTPSARATS